MNEKMNRLVCVRTGGILSLLLGLAMVLGAPGSAQATLLNGETVSFTYFFPDITSVYGSPSDGNYLVGAGVEILNGFCCGFEGTLDISDTNMLADFGSSTFYTPGSFNGFKISDVFGTIDSFTSVAINASTNMIGFDASRVTFDANNIWVNWQGLGFDENTIVSLDINGGSAVPEPGTLSLLVLGLLATGLRQRARSV